MTTFQPVPDELAKIRKGSAKLAAELGYGAVAIAIRAGGPLEQNLRFLHHTIDGRRPATRLITDETRQYAARQNARIDAMKKGLSLLIERVKQLAHDPTTAGQAAKHRVDLAMRKLR